MLRGVVRRTTTNDERNVFFTLIAARNSIENSVFHKIFAFSPISMIIHSDFSVFIRICTLRKMRRQWSRKVKKLRRNDGEIGRAGVVRER